MTKQPPSDPVLKQFRTALDEIYGAQLERLVLYGSRARGDAAADSDYDVAVFLRGLKDRWTEMDKIAVVATDILKQTGAVISALAYPEGAYNERSPLMHEIRREGLDL